MATDLPESRNETMQKAKKVLFTVYRKHLWELVDQYPEAFEFIMEGHCRQCGKLLPCHCEDE